MKGGRVASSSSSNVLLRKVVVGLQVPNELGVLFVQNPCQSQLHLQIFTVQAYIWDAGRQNLQVSTLAYDWHQVLDTDRQSCCRRVGIDHRGYILDNHRQFLIELNLKQYISSLQVPESIIFCSHIQDSQQNLENVISCTEISKLLVQLESCSIEGSCRPKVYSVQRQPGDSERIQRSISPTSS